MTAFIVLAIALTFAVLALLLRPLWRGSRKLALGIAATVAISTLALYQLVGTPTALDAQALAMPPTLNDALVQLEAQLDRDPKQPDGWRLLGQAYTTEQRFADAREAYAKAAALAPDSASTWILRTRSNASANKA